MPNLEQVVRPSQTVDIRPGYPQAARQNIAVAGDDEVVFGAPGNDVFALQASSKNSVNNTDSKETSRTFDTIRIKSESDPNTYVDVEVMTAYQARNVIDKSRTSLRFDKPEAGDNVEVVARNQTRKTDT